MKNIYIIVMVCIDRDCDFGEDYKIYSDYVNKVFTDYETAKTEMVKCAIGEVNDLDNAKMVNMGDEVVVYVNYEMVTKYSIAEVGVENE